MQYIVQQQYSLCGRLHSGSGRVLSPWFVKGGNRAVQCGTVQESVLAVVVFVVLLLPWLGRWWLGAGRFPPASVLNTLSLIHSYFIYNRLEQQVQPGSGVLACVQCGPSVWFQSSTGPRTKCIAPPPLQVRRYSLVLDPFVGTGSVLVPATHLGALTLGADIDIRVIKIGGFDIDVVLLGEGWGAMHARSAWLARGMTDRKGRVCWVG